MTGGSSSQHECKFSQIQTFALTRSPHKWTQSLKISLKHCNTTQDLLSTLNRHWTSNPNSCPNLHVEGNVGWCHLRKKKIVTYLFRVCSLPSHLITTCFCQRLCMLFRTPGIFCPKMIIRFICPARNLRLKVEYFCPKFSISRSLSTLQLPRAFRSSWCILYQESYLQLLFNGQGGLISPKLGTRTIIMGRRAYLPNM